MRNPSGPGRTGPGGLHDSPGRAELKLNRAGRAFTISGPLRAGPGYKKLARFDPWWESESEVSCDELLTNY
jgi:hypothetical protein